MLIQQFRCLLLLQLIALTFAFGAAKKCTIGFGLLSRFLACNSLLKSVQIDQIAHDAPIIFQADAMRSPSVYAKLSFVSTCSGLIGTVPSSRAVSSRGVPEI